MYPSVYIHTVHTIYYTALSKFFKIINRLYSWYIFYWYIFSVLFAMTATFLKWVNKKNIKSLYYLFYLTNSMWKVKLVLINSFQIVNLKFCTNSPVIGKNAVIKTIEYCGNSARFFYCMGGMLTAELVLHIYLSASILKTFFWILNWCAMYCWKKSIYYNIPPCEERIFI